MSAHGVPGSDPTVLAAAAPLFARVDQVCVLVESIEEAIATYSQLFAVTRWRAGEGCSSSSVIPSGSWK